MYVIYVLMSSIYHVKTSDILFLELTINGREGILLILGDLRVFNEKLQCIVSIMIR